MRIICGYTGIGFHVEYFNQKKLTGHHPIFDVDYNELLSMAVEWSKYDDTERHLLFVAMLKTTELVDFRAPAVPSQQTINKYMEPLIHVCQWKQTIGDTLSLPGFRVTRDNYTLKGIGGFIYRWNDIKNEWTSKSTNQQLAEILRVREAYILRRIRGGHLELVKLGKWIMSVANVPPPMVDSWLSIFSLRETEDKQKIWNLHIEELTGFLNHLTLNLPAETTLAEMAFGHMRRLVSINKGGIEASLLDLENTGARQSGDYTILPSGGNVVRWTGPGAGTSKLPSLHSILENMDNTPSVEDINYLLEMKQDSKPKEADYNSRTEYLRALAGWQIEAYNVKKHNEQILATRNAQKTLDTDVALGQDDNLEAGTPDTEEEHIIRDINRRNGASNNE